MPVTAPELAAFLRIQAQRRAQAACPGGDGQRLRVLDRVQASRRSRLVVPPPREPVEDETPGQ